MAEPKKIPKKVPKELKNKKNLKDDEKSETSDIFDEDGYIDENDRELLLQKTEKERESILYERGLMKEDHKKKKKLEKEQIKKDELLKKNPETKHPKFKKALDDLQLKRTLEKEKSKNPATRRKFSDESSPASSNEDEDKSSDFEGRDDPNKKEDEDDIQKFSKKNDGSKKKVNSSLKPEEKTLELKDIESIRLTRHMIEKMISQPNFEKTAKGCFVRLSVSSEKNKTSYVIAEIIDIMENSKAYKIDIKETKKVLFLRHADKEKKFEISFVSNGKLENSEFVNWLDKMELKKVIKPTPAQIVEKIQDIKEALNYEYDEEELTEIIKKKIDQKISVNSPSSKDLTAEINYCSQRLGTLEFEFFQTKNEIDYCYKILGTTKLEYNETENEMKKTEIAKQIKELTEQLSILREKHKKICDVKPELTEKLSKLKERQKEFGDNLKKRDVLEEAYMKKMFGAYMTKTSKTKKVRPINEQENRSKKNFSPKKTFKTLDEKLQQCASAKEYESIKEEFLQIFQKKFDFENEIENWTFDENDIL